MKWPAFIKAEYRYQFGSSFALWGYGIGIFLNLLIYYFTSKAFSPIASIGNVFLSKGYFEFIIIGELSLIIPQIAIGEGQEAFFRFKESGILEQLYFSKLGLFKSLIHVYYSLIFFKFIFILFSLVIAAAFFHLSLSFTAIVLFLSVQLLSSFLFLGIYFLNLCISFLIGRRNGSIQHIVNVLCFFSGAYFPLEIFSSVAIRNILSHSPFALQVVMTRSLIYNQNFGDFQNAIYYLTWCLAPAALAFILFRFFIRRKLGMNLC
jgi:ABC-type polysaccharide/polyol phosphate export permease